MLSGKFIQLGINLMERGVIPDSMMRRTMRQLCSQRLRSKCDWDFELQKLIVEANRSSIAHVPEIANEQHYEVPATFFETVLGRHRKYSCCYWPDGVDNLNDAEAAALSETCRRAEIEPGMDVLELGCGWGAMTLWIAEHYPGTRVTAISNSHSQREFIEQRAAERGLTDQISVITADINEFDVDTRFDRIVSLEMFEHMRNHQLLMRRISNWLTHDGKLFVHIFCHREQAYLFLDEGPTSWMSRYFFTGGMMPSRDLLLHYSDHLESTAIWDWSGSHYQKTSDAWLKRLDDNREEVMPILRETYGSDANRWFHRWRMFFLACSELFGYNEGKEWFVAHYLFSPVSSGVALM